MTLNHLNAAPHTIARKRSGFKDISFMYLMHLEYKITEHKGNKNRSEMGGVLNIKATLRIQIGKTQRFLSKSIECRRLVSSKSERKTEAVWGAGSRPLPSGEVSPICDERLNPTVQWASQAQSQSPIMYTNFCIDASLQSNNRFALVAE